MSQQPPPNSPRPPQFGQQQPSGPPPGWRPGPQQSRPGQAGGPPQGPRGPQQHPGPQNQPYGTQGQQFGPQGPQQGQQFGPQGQQYGQGPQGQPYGPQGQQFRSQGQQQTKSRTPKIIVAAVVAVALIAGAVVLGTQFLGGSTPAAAKGLPADTLAVMEINLAPSAGDQMELKEFVEKFPALQGETDQLPDNYKEALWQLIPDDETKPEWSEVEPWLGDSIAIGMLDSVQTVPNRDMAVAIEVTDEEAAQAFADKHFPDESVSLHDGLMVVTDGDAPLEAADVVENSLADTDAYKADMDELGDGYLATAWFSEKALEGLQGMPTDMPAPAPMDLPAMHGAFGLKIDDGNAVVRSVMATEDFELPEGGGTDELVGALPAGMFVAGGQIPDATYQQLWDVISSDPNVMSGLSQYGITTVDDLRAVVGSQLGISVSITNDMPVFGLAVQTDNPDLHSQVVSRLLTDMGLHDAQHEVIGDLAYTTYGMSPSEMAEPANPASGIEAYDELTEGSGDVHSVAYLDMDQLVQFMDRTGADPQLTENLAPISGIGITGSKLNDTYAESFIRIGTK